MWTLWFTLCAAASWLPRARAATCAGEFVVPGYGSVSLTKAKWNIPKQPATDVQVGAGGVLVAYLKGRAYFSDSCVEGEYDPNRYVAWKLLNKTLTYTVDLGSAGCGCNAALYMVSMRQNTQPSGCFDYYCDANSVCGVPCAEIDMQEANNFAWHSTLHTAQDHGGVGSGYGGGSGWNGPRNFLSQQYSPGSSCIDTGRPFQVSISYPTNASGQLIAQRVHMVQDGKICKVSADVEGYRGNAELTRALSEGMTPVISYWSADAMTWLDGQGADGLGGCASDNATACPPTVKFWDFQLADISEPSAPPVVVPAPSAPERGRGDDTKTQMLTMQISGTIVLISLVLWVLCCFCNRSRASSAEKSDKLVVDPAEDYIMSSLLPSSHQGEALGTMLNSLTPRPPSMHSAEVAFTI